MTTPQYDQPAPAKKSKAKGCGCLAVVAVVAVIGIGAAMSSKSAPTASGSSPAVTAATGAATHAAAAPATTAAAPAADTITYIVTGSNADVQYGPAGSSSQGHVPMSITKKLGTPQYASISVQLQGGGAASCQIKVNGKVVSKATATGGYNIAQCEISQDPINGGWMDTNGN